MGSRCCALESAGTRMCRETQRSGREEVAEGLPLHGGAQLAVDTTLVSAHHCDGTAKPGAAHIVVARRRKERTHPELVGPRSRAKLVVLAGEVGGRWSEETLSFLRLLAAARAFAASLLEQRSDVGGDANVPLISDVLSEFRHADLGLC